MQDVSFLSNRWPRRSDSGQPLPSLLERPDRAVLCQPDARDLTWRDAGCSDRFGSCTNRHCGRLRISDRHSSVWLPLEHFGFCPPWLCSIHDCAGRTSALRRLVLVAAPSRGIDRLTARPDLRRTPIGRYVRPKHVRRWHYRVHEVGAGTDSRGTRTRVRRYALRGVGSRLTSHLPALFVRTLVELARRSAGNPTMAGPRRRR